MSLITFECASPAATWSPTHNPNYGSDDPAIRRHQPVDLSDGGDVYSYNHGQSTPITLHWAKMPSADLATLLAFFTAIAGAANTFTYTDWDADTHTVRLASDGLNHRYSDATRHDVTIDLEVA